MTEHQRFRIGIDLGGTKIQAVVVDGSGAVVGSKRVITPRDYRGTVAVVRELVDALELEVAGPARVGVGSPGSVSPATGQLRNSNAPWLLARDLSGDLTRELRRPILLENDANCFALSETSPGSPAGAEVVLGVVLGSGVGSGLVVGEQIIRGRNLIGGEFGHCSLPWPKASEHPGRRCYCGRMGCIETFLSGSGLLRDYIDSGGEANDVADIVELASSGGESAITCLSRFYDRLARSLAMMVNVLDPDVIVVGGGLGNIRGIFDEVPGRLGAWIFSDCFETPLLPAAHGNLSSARGAALLWAD